MITLDTLYVHEDCESGQSDGYYIHHPEAHPKLGADPLIILYIYTLDHVLYKLRTSPSAFVKQLADVLGAAISIPSPNIALIFQSQPLHRWRSLRDSGCASETCLFHGVWVQYPIFQDQTLTFTLQPDAKRLLTSIYVFKS